MKKLILLMLVTGLAAFIAAAQSSSALFTDGRWEAIVSYRDAGGESHNDQYEIVFVKTGVCFITVRTKEKGADLFQDGDGLWSYSEGDFPVLRIECEFPNSAIKRLPSINWTSLYQFDGDKTRFTLLIPPFPDAERNIKVSFIQTKDEN
jgi:hypothetical protein